MAELTLDDISEKMRDIDFTILSTRTAGGQIAARPMSNNRQVEYDGDSYFFTCDDTRTIRDIHADPNVGLGLQGKSGALGMKPFFITIEGRAELIKDKSRFAEHWTKDLDAWFKEGADTPGARPDQGARRASALLGRLRRGRTPSREIGARAGGCAAAALNSGTSYAAKRFKPVQKRGGMPCTSDWAD